MTLAKSKRETLRSAPTRFRAAPSRGSMPKVDREAGVYGAGLIRDVSICTRGEALGHDMWLDAEFIDSVNKHLAKAGKGVKSRFTHPGLSSDGLGKVLARAKSSYVKGDKVFADLHLLRASRKTPDGDLGGYVMDLAEEDPEAFGVSIVFESDIGAENKHYANHQDEDGNFTSPDSDNISNFPHARLAELLASDVVDDPAANPDGMFYREQEFAQEAEAVAEFALGLTTDKPTATRLGLDAERTASFVSRFLDSRGLTILKRDPEMTKEQIDAALKEQSDKLSAEHTAAIEKLNADHAAEVAALKSGPKVDDLPTPDQVKLAERTRVKELTALAANAGISDQAVLGRWIDKDCSLSDAKLEIADLAIKQNKLSKEDPTTEDGASEVAVRQEYRVHAKLHKSMGMDEAEYVAMRKEELAKSA